MSSVFLKLFSQAKRPVHRALHDPKKSSVEIGGQTFHFEAAKTKKSERAYRKCTVFGVQFMQQNPNKTSEYAEQARNGGKVTWVPWGKAWGLIIDDEIKKRCAAFSESVVRAPQVAPSPPPLASSSSMSPPASLSRDGSTVYHLPIKIETQGREDALGEPSRKRLKLSDGSAKGSLSDEALADWMLPYEALVFKELIGSGAFGEVKRGEYSGKEVAIKVLHTQDAKAQEMFKKEASLLASLTHGNIVPCVGFSVHEGKLCLVMDFMPISLSQYVKEHHPLSETLIRNLALGIAKGISYLHSEKIIHRDLKPANILLDATLTPRIADFGVSREAATMNATMTKIGTPTYCAPEVLNGDRYSFPADIYSYGMILCAMTCGGNPWKSEEGLGPAQIITRVVVKKDRPRLPPNTSASMAALISKCWNHEPLLRPTAEEIITALALPAELLDNMDVDSQEPTVATMVFTDPHLTPAADAGMNEKDEEEDYVVEDDPVTGDIYGSISRKKRCRFDDKCYRANPLHFAQYSHPKREAKKAYRDALTHGLEKSNKITRSLKTELSALRTMNGVSDDEHVEILKSVGWTVEEYGAGVKNEAPAPTSAVSQGVQPRLPRKRKLE